MLRAFQTFLLCIGLLSVTAFADHVVKGRVSGTWTRGDKISVIGNIVIPQNESLIIEPGVRVEFRGPYQFIVYGRLHAKGTNNAWIVITRAGTTNKTNWLGFHFFGANDKSILEYCDISYCHKEFEEWERVRGGAFLLEFCSPTIRYCNIHNNFTHNDNYNGCGAAIMMERECNSLIEFNHIHHNTTDSGGGIAIGDTCHPIIRYNLIERNRAFHSGGGIYTHSYSEVYGNVIKSNRAEGYGGGGICIWNSFNTYKANVYNNFIIENSCTSNSKSAGGGGIYTRYVESHLYNNTLIGNKAVRGGGVFVITFDNLPPYLFNSILWKNDAEYGPQIYLYPDTGSDIHVSHCDIMGGYPGIGNMNDDPRFANPGEGDYHLMYSSPCRDSGSDLVLKLPTMDFEGDRRLVDESIDMGADEFQPHFYYTGDAVPSGEIKLKLVGFPRTGSLVLFMGSGKLPVPLKTPYGNWYLEPPFTLIETGGCIPLCGIAEFPQILPAMPENTYFLQALMGEYLSNPLFLEISP